MVRVDDGWFGHMGVKHVGKRLPMGAIDLLQRARGLSELGCRKRLQRLLHDNVDAADAKKLGALVPYGSMHASFIEEYAACGLRKVKERESEPGLQGPIAVCVIKDDLLRLQLFLAHYRKLGVRAFAFLDDHSSDGTCEYLMRQPDVSLYVANKPYTTMRRQVWINRMIAVEGVPRWYLVVDSDELLDYPHSDMIAVDELCTRLAESGETRAKAIMLDMFSGEALFPTGIHGATDVEPTCDRFFNRFFFTKTSHGYQVQGGGRALLFSMAGIDREPPIISKYPLVYVDEKEVFVNSHYGFPNNRNRPDKPSVVLRHYKFLPGDLEKFSERVKGGNFYSGSAEYRAYLDLADVVAYAEFAKELERFEGDEAFKRIHELDPIT